MPVYKLIKNGEVVNTIIADASFFSSPSDLWDSYEEVVPPPPPEPVPPEPTPEPPPPDITVTPVQFKLLFTPQERVAIRALKVTDPVIEDFFDIVDDPRLTEVNLSLQSTKDALAYLTSTGVLTEERKTEILLGQLQ